MSLILDALRKSERTRQQSLTGQLGAAEIPSGPGRLPVPWVPLIAVLLVANGLLLFFLWPRTPVAVPVAHVDAVATAPAVAYRPAVRSLADEAGDQQAAAPPQTGTTAPSPSTQVAQAPADAPDTAARPSTPDAASLPTFEALPADLRAALPALHMDVHGYSGNAKDRFVVINLKQYHVGDVLEEGPTLKDIVAQGAVLEFRGTTFLLPAY
jgi:general secretion pathway protein B